MILVVSGGVVHAVNHYRQYCISHSVNTLPYVYVHATKTNPQISTHDITSSNTGRFPKFFHCHILQKFATKRSLNIPPDLKRVATAQKRSADCIAQSSGYQYAYALGHPLFKQLRDKVVQSDHYLIFSSFRELSLS